MTKEELKKYDGKDGRPAYIGYKGKVYDVSASDFWSGGTHMGRFHAGEDMTESIVMAPHGEANIFRFKEVGVLDDAGEPAGDSGDSIAPQSESVLSDMDRKMIAKRKLYRKYHPHPITVHFPMGMYGYAFFAQVLGALTGGLSGFFLTASGLTAMIFGTAFLIPAIASGLLSFSINYNRFANVYLKRKMILSCVAFILSVLAVYIGIHELTGNSDITEIVKNIDAFRAYNHFGSLYTLLNVLTFATILAIGFNGGKLTWPEDKK